MGNIKDLPAGVPEENEYHSLHWAAVLTYLGACGAPYADVCRIGQSEFSIGNSQIRMQSIYQTGFYPCAPCTRTNELSASNTHAYSRGE